MKRIILISIIILTNLFTFAQQDEKAKNILDQMSEKTRSYETIQAEFSYSMDNSEMDIHEAFSGSIKLKGKSYTVNIPEGGMVMYSDGETLWNYMEDGNQVTISTIDEESDVLDNPSSIFNLYEKGFQSKFVEEKTEGNKVLFIIELFPEDDFQDISKIILAVDKSTLMIDSAVLSSTDDTLYTIKVNKLETNKSLPDSDFVFNADDYEDIEIIDFR